MNKTNRRCLVLLVLISFVSPTLYAQDQDSGLSMLEEVVVTAQKRAESLQDVPLSIVAMQGDKLRESNVYRMEDLQLKVPNLQMTESGISTQLYVRGIGTGNNQGFEQSVGMYVDGIYYGRQQLIRLPIFDIERVEVLRGPQGILFGKNAIAGAVKYTTAEPRPGTSGYVRAEYDSEHDATLLEAVVNVGNDTFAARIAARKYDDDGYVFNTFENRDEPQRDDSAFRAKFLWNANEDVSLSLKVEQQNFETTGRQIEIIEDNPAGAAAPIPGATYAQILGALGHPGAITDILLDDRRSADGGDSSDNEVENITLKLDWALGENTLTAISGYMSYDFLDNCDCDYTAAPVFNVVLDEEYEQFSQEVRLVSPGGEDMDWLVGAFYQSSDLDFADAIDVPANSVLGLLSAQLVPILGTSAGRTFLQDSDLFAVFGQATWNLDDHWALTAGARWTTEDKDGFREINAIDTATGRPLPPVPDHFAGAVYTGAFGILNQQFTGHRLIGNRSEDEFLPLLRVEYRPTDGAMWYASAASGFKAGGFDARSNGVTSFEFENEDADTFELGGKFRYMGGRAETNFALYFTDYDGLQISQFDGTLGFNVGNAKSTEVRGIEIDGRLAISDQLTWTYALAYLDHEFKDFRNANCYNGEVPNGDVVDGVALCDRTGWRGQYTPEFTAYTSLDYATPIGNDWELKLTGDLSHTSSQNVHVNLDPKYEISSFTIFDFRAAVRNNRWELAVLGANLSDEDFLTYVNNAPLSGSTFGTNTFYGFNIREKSWWLQATYHYGQ